MEGNINNEDGNYEKEEGNTKKKEWTLKKWGRKHWQKTRKATLKIKMKETFYKKIGNKHWKKYEGDFLYKKRWGEIFAKKKKKKKKNRKETLKKRGRKLFWKKKIGRKHSKNEEGNTDKRKETPKLGREHWHLRATVYLLFRNVIDLKTKNWKWSRSSHWVVTCKIAGLKS